MKRKLIPLSFSQIKPDANRKRFIAYKNIDNLKHFYFVDISYDSNKTQKLNKIIKINQIDQLLYSKILSSNALKIFSEVTKNISCVEYTPIGYKCSKTLVGKNHYFCCITQLKTLEHNPIPMTLHVIESPEKNYIISSIQHL